MSKTEIKRPRISQGIRETVLGFQKKGMGPSEILKALRREKNGHVLSLRSIQTIVSQAKDVKNGPEFKGFFETPWHLGMLEDWPMPATEVAALLRWQSKQPERTLYHLRYAIWFSRLHVFIGNEMLCAQFALEYAHLDEAWMLSGLDLPADTTILDALLLKMLAQSPRWSQRRSDELSKAGYEARVATIEKVLKTKGVQP